MKNKNIFSGQCLFVEENPINSSEMTAGGNLINSNSPMDATNSGIHDLNLNHEMKGSRKRKVSYS